MDFLDPQKRRANKVRLLVGYGLVAIAILLSLRLLLYVAVGYGVDKGKIIQNGFLFISSHPGGAQIRLNGSLTATTDARLTLPAATYQLKLDRTGYRTWWRSVTIEGDSVARFDYPFLFPGSLKTNTISSFTSVPAVATQSPNRRFLLIEPSVVKLGSFELYDLLTPQTAAAPTAVSLPSDLLTTPNTAALQQLIAVDWSDDNQHVLLEHKYDKTYEYIMFDTKTPSKSVNLNRLLKTNPTKLTLLNKRYDQYFVYDAPSQNLSTASLSDPTPVLMLQHVLDYATYGNNIVLYASSQGATTKQTPIMLYQNNQNYLLRTVAASSTYLLDLTQYSGSWYIAIGSSGENRVYVYQNPLDELTAQDGAVLVPAAVLRVMAPNYLAFSASAQFIMAENARSFSVYDVQYQNTYNYTETAPFDALQPHATWMDGDRLTYLSGGKLVVFDYDSTNFQMLMPASPSYDPFFDQTYKYVYALAPRVASGKTPAATDLTDTALLTPADL